MDRQNRSRSCTLCFVLPHTIGRPGHSARSANMNTEERLFKIFPAMYQKIFSIFVEVICGEEGLSLQYRDHVMDESLFLGYIIAQEQ